MRGEANSTPSRLLLICVNSTEAESQEDACDYNPNDHLMTSMDHDPHDLIMTSTDLQADIYWYSFPYGKQSCSQGWELRLELELAHACQRGTLRGGRFLPVKRRQPGQAIGKLFPGGKIARMETEL